MKQKINSTERSAWQSQKMLVIIVVALDSFWQTSSLSYVLEFEKNHIVLQESRIDVRDSRKILWHKEFI